MKNVTLSEVEGCKNKQVKQQASTTLSLTKNKKRHSELSRRV